MLKTTTLSGNLRDAKHISLNICDFYFGNLLYPLKKVTKSEADKKFAIEVQNYI
jgi:hypothetical protein